MFPVVEINLQKATFIFVYNVIVLNPKMEANITCVETDTNTGQFKCKVYSYAN